MKKNQDYLDNNIQTTKSQNNREETEREKQIYLQKVIRNRKAIKQIN